MFISSFEKNKTTMEKLDELFNSIIKSNSIYHNIHPEILLNQLNSYNNIDINTPSVDPDTLEINTILSGQDNDLYIIRPSNNGNIWTLIPRKV